VSLLDRHLRMSSNKRIIFIGWSSSHVDNVSAGTSPMVVVPPAGMKAGDLVYCSGYCASGSLTTWNISVTGGQSWAWTIDRNSALPSVITAYCVFNGIWTANPQFTASAGGVAKAVQMLVFRPAYSGGSWATDQQSGIALTGGVSGVTYYITGITNTHNRLVTIARGIGTTAGATYVSHTPSSFGWVPAHFRNLSSNNKNAMYFFQFQPIGGYTGDIIVTMPSVLSVYNSMHSFYYT